MLTSLVFSYNRTRTIHDSRLPIEMETIGKKLQKLEAKRKQDEKKVQKLIARLLELEHWIPFR